MRIPIVNEQDEILEYKQREKKDPKDIFRVAGLWVTALNGDILLAQRSSDKKSNPGLWGPAVAGTVEEGETYESNIIKEAEEEIGLVGLTPILGPKMKSVSSEYFIQWFTAVVDRGYPFIKQDKEVKALKWVAKKEVGELLEKEPHTFLPYFKQYLEILK